MCWCFTSIPWCIDRNKFSILSINSKFGNQMAPLELVPNLVTRWHHLHQFKIGHQMAPLALVTIALPHCLGLSYWLYQLVLSWYFSTSDLRYFLESNLYFIQICIFWFVANRIKIWSSGDIISKVRRLSTRLSHLHCHIALDNPIDFVS